MYVWGEIYESPGKYKGVASSVLLATLLMRYILQFDEFFDARVLFLQKFFKKTRQITARAVLKSGRRLQR